MANNLNSWIKSIRDIMRNDAGINGDAQRIEQIAWLLFLKVYAVKEQDWEALDYNYRSIIPEHCRWHHWAHDRLDGKALTGDRLLDFVNNTLFPTLKNLPVGSNTPIKQAIVQTMFEDANQYMKDGVLLRQVINKVDELALSKAQEIHAFGDLYENILKELQNAGPAGEFYTPRAVTKFMAWAVQPKIGERCADFACGTGGFLTGWLQELESQIHTVGEQRAVDNSVYGIEKKQFPYMLCVTNMLLHDIDVPQIYHDNALAKDLLDYGEQDKFDVVLMNPPYGGSEKDDIKTHFPKDLASSETADLFMAVIMYRLKTHGRAAVILPDGFLFGTDGAKLALKRKLLHDFNLHTVVRLPKSVFAPYTTITTNILFFNNTGTTRETWFYRLDLPEGYKAFSKTKPIQPRHFDELRAWWNNRHAVTVDNAPKACCYPVNELIERNYNIDLCGYPHDEQEILPPGELIAQYQRQRTQLNGQIDAVLAQITDSLGISLPDSNS